MSKRPTLKILACVLSVLFLFLNSGCGILNKDTFAKDESGAYIKHYYSCGPEAIQDALVQLGEGYPSRPTISKEIQENGNSRRLTLALFHKDAMWITWPAELVKYFEKRNYTLSRVGIDSLKQGDVAIVLLKYKPLTYHWATYPSYTKEKIKKLFGPKTKIIDAYLIKKRAAN